MSTLYLLTNMFPYGDVEPYLETEIKFYDKFDKVYIFALQIREDQFAREREVGNNVTVIPIKKASNWKYALNVLSTLVDRNLYKEFKRLKTLGRLSKENFIKLLVYFSRSHYEARLIDKIIKDKVEDNSIFYSYRFEYQPYVAVLLKKKWKINSQIVSRAHRYDLYEEVNQSKYIPMREELLCELDGVYPCSEDGANYLKEKFPAYAEKISTRYLGTKNLGVEAQEYCEQFQVVSCSNVIEVKRLNLIVAALSKIERKKIKWTHFGEGKLLPQIRAQAEKELPENIQFDFRGNLNNECLLEEYKTHYYHLFINVSESEGLPVSIMEAMSFGIPCIATDVGATSEIVNNKTGVLLQSHPSVEEVALAIEQIINKSREEYNEYRKQARLNWERKFNCDNNYQEFTKELLGMTKCD